MSSPAELWRKCWTPMTVRAQVIFAVLWVSAYIAGYASGYIYHLSFLAQQALAWGAGGLVALTSFRVRHKV